MEQQPRRGIQALASELLLFGLKPGTEGMIHRMIYLRHGEPHVVGVERRLVVLAGSGPEMAMKGVCDIVCKEPDRIHVGFAAPADCTILDHAVLHVVVRKRWYFLFKI